MVNSNGIYGVGFDPEHGGFVSLRIDGKEYSAEYIRQLVKVSNEAIDKFDAKPSYPPILPSTPAKAGFALCRVSSVGIISLVSNEPTYEKAMERYERLNILYDNFLIIPSFFFAPRVP